MYSDGMENVGETEGVKGRRGRRCGGAGCVGREGRKVNLHFR